MRVAVIGGGLGGLAAARALVAGGVDAHVLEGSERVGGVIATTRVDGYVREHAASSFLGGPPRGAAWLCGELGVAVERASPRARRRWIYIDGKLRALPGSPIALARSDLLTWRGKLALLGEPLRPSRAAGEDESVYEFATRRLGAEAARAIVAPFVTGVFAADAHDVSLEAGFPRFAALDADGGLVRGMAKRAARAVMARVRGQRGDGTRGGMYAPIGGLGAMIDGMERELGPRVHTGVRVRALEPARGGVTIDGERWDGAVLAVAADLASALCTAALPEVASRLSSFARAPVALVYLALPEATAPRAADGFGFLVARGEDLRVLGVVFESTVWPGRAPAGHVLLRCIFGGARDPAAVDLSDAELIAQARRDVERALGATGEPSHASIVRHRRGIAQYRVGHRDAVRAAVAAARLHRVALAGADYRGTGVNDVIADGEVVAEEILAW